MIADGFAMVDRLNGFFDLIKLVTLFRKLVPAFK
jgi:hypothetical protein